MKTRLIALIFSLYTTAAIAETTWLQSLPPVKAPDFQLADLDGKSHKLSDYYGKTIVINFWATWCPPCRKEIPSMNKALTKLDNKKVVMLAVNMAEESDAVLEFTNNNEVNFTILLDSTGKASAQWPMKGLPTTFIVDAKGNIVYRAIGEREWSQTEIINMINKL